MLLLRLLLLVSFCLAAACTAVVELWEVFKRDPEGVKGVLRSRVPFFDAAPGHSDMESAFDCLPEDLQVCECECVCSVQHTHGGPAVQQPPPASALCERSRQRCPCQPANTLLYTDVCPSDATAVCYGSFLPLLPTQDALVTLLLYHLISIDCQGTTCLSFAVGKALLRVMQHYTDGCMEVVDVSAPL